MDSRSATPAKPIHRINFLTGRRGRTNLLVPVAVIGLSLLAVGGVYLGVLGVTWLRLVSEWTAQWSAIGLGLAGIETQVEGTIISTDAFAVDIVAECTAIGPLLLYAGAVVAYPSRFRWKGLGIALGLSVITFVNLIRIGSLFWIGSNHPQFLDFVHLVVWQSVIALLAIILWLYWAGRAARARH